MSSLYRPRIITYRLADGSYRTPDGKRVTKQTPGAVKVDEGRSDVWYGKYANAAGRPTRVQLCKDKTASKQMLAKIETEAALARRGLADPNREGHQKRPLSEHVADFQRYLEAKGNTAKHARQTCHRVEAVLAGCKFESIADLSASALVEWLASERAADRMGIRTSNYYLRDTKAFCRWLVKERRTGDNPLAHVSGMNAQVEAGMERRALPAEDFAALVEAARNGTTVR